MLHQLVLDLIEVVPATHAAICRLLLVLIEIIILVLVHISEIIIFKVIVFSSKLLSCYLLVLAVAVAAHGCPDSLADASGAAIATEI